MNVALWILQVLVAIAFAIHAVQLLRPNPAQTQGGMKYILEMPAGLRLFAGVAEALAAVALLVSPFIHPIAWLAPLAAIGLVVLMIGAIVFHSGRREWPNLGLNAALGVLAAI